MKFEDFRYDGRSLNELGYEVCSFDSSSDSVTPNPSEITFNTVSMNFGKQHYLASAVYSEALETSFQVCKNSCDFVDINITEDEIREITRWLNRKEFLPVKLTSTEGNDYYTNASFNVSCVYFDDICYGFEITIQTDKPYLEGKDICYEFNIEEENGNFTVYDYSDDIGFTNVKLDIVLNSSGTLKITNSVTNRRTQILNCTLGEHIELNYPIITSTKAKIENRFNWEFLKLSNVYNNRVNILSFSLPCSVTLIYTPNIKLGI